MPGGCAPSGTARREACECIVARQGGNRVCSNAQLVVNETIYPGMLLYDPCGPIHSTCEPFSNGFRCASVESPQKLVAITTIEW